MPAHEMAVCEIYIHELCGGLTGNPICHAPIWHACFSNCKWSAAMDFGMFADTVMNITQLCTARAKLWFLAGWFSHSNMRCCGCTDLIYDSACNGMGSYETCVTLTDSGMLTPLACRGVVKLRYGIFSKHSRGLAVEAHLKRHFVQTQGIADGLSEQNNLEFYS